MLKEGKKRQIRRMCEAVGYRVDRLVRIHFGPIELGRLEPGDWRPLRDEEVEALRAAVGLAARVDRDANLTSRTPAAKHRRSSRKRAAMRGVEQSGSSRGS